MTTTLVTPLRIETYLQEMQMWLDADVRTYKNLFSSSITRNPSDFTKAPGVIYTSTLPVSTQGYLSIPLASSILSAMEFCGFCLKGKFKNFSRSEENIKIFYKEIKNIMPAGSTPLKNDDIAKLIKSCRHGFAHKFFPKHLIGVGYYEYTDDLFISDPTGFVLNTNALIIHITFGLGHILSSPHLFPGMQRCYDDYLNQVENGTITLTVTQKGWKKIKKLFS